MSTGEPQTIPQAAPQPEFVQGHHSGNPSTETVPEPVMMTGPDQYHAQMSFDQAIKLLKLSFMKLVRSESGYNAVSKVISGDQEPPIISWPTGGKDQEGNQIKVEFDLKHMVPSGPNVSPEEQSEFLKRFFTPFNNQCAQEFSQCLDSIIRAATEAKKHMS